MQMMIYGRHEVVALLRPGLLGPRFTAVEGDLGISWQTHHAGSYGQTWSNACKYTLSTLQGTDRASGTQQSAVGDAQF